MHRPNNPRVRQIIEDVELGAVTVGSALGSIYFACRGIDLFCNVARDSVLANRHAAAETLLATISSGIALGCAAVLAEIAPTVDRKLEELKQIIRKP